MNQLAECSQLISWTGNGREGSARTGPLIPVGEPGQSLRAPLRGTRPLCDEADINESSDTVIRHPVGDSDQISPSAIELYRNGIRFGSAGDTNGREDKEEMIETRRHRFLQKRHKASEEEIGIGAAPISGTVRSPTQSVKVGNGESLETPKPTVAPKKSKESFLWSTSQTIIDYVLEKAVLPATDSLLHKEIRNRTPAPEKQPGLEHNHGGTAMDSQAVAPRKRRAVSLNAALRAQIQNCQWPDPRRQVSRLMQSGRSVDTSASDPMPENSSRFNTLPARRNPNLTFNADSSTVQNEDNTVASTPQSPRALGDITANSRIPRIPSFKLMDDSAPVWGNRLIRDLANSRLARRGESACTPITTTTGSETPPQPSTRATAANKSRIPSVKGVTSGRPSSPGEVSGMSTAAKRTVQSSLPRPPQRDSPNNGHSPGTPVADISSFRQLTPTKLRTMKLSQRAVLAETARRTSMEDLARRFTSTSTTPTQGQPTRSDTPPPPYGQSPSTPTNNNQEGPELNEAIAQGAAQMALRKASKLVDVPTPPPMIVGEWQPGQRPDLMDSPTPGRKASSDLGTLFSLVPTPPTPPRPRPDKTSSRDNLRNENNSGKTNAPDLDPGRRRDDAATDGPSTARGVGNAEAKKDDGGSASGAERRLQSDEITGPERPYTAGDNPPATTGLSSVTPVLAVFPLLAIYALHLVHRLARAYWREAAPVFDASSQVRRRVAAQQSGWRDMLAHGLAGGLVFVAVVALVWVARLLALFWGMATVLCAWGGVVMGF